LKAYEQERLEATARIVLTNRANPPTRSCAKSSCVPATVPSSRIEDVISAAEIAAISEGYKRVAGYDRAAMSTSKAES
jgi:hypothetical protein